jgi:hypothetical protein
MKALANEPPISPSPAMPMERKGSFGGSLNLGIRFLLGKKLSCLALAYGMIAVFLSIWEFKKLSLN